MLFYLNKKIVEIIVYKKSETDYHFSVFSNGELGCNLSSCDQFFKIAYPATDILKNC